MPRRSKIKSTDKWTAEEEMRRYELFLPKRKHEPGGRKTLVLDGHNLAYAAYYAYSKLTYRGKSVSIIYGMAQVVKALISQKNPLKVIICWDGDKHPERMRLLPTYKHHREKNRDKKQRKAFLKEIDRAQRMFYYLGIPQAYSKEIEGDDMIYMVTQKEKVLAPVEIVSGDKDMAQLIDWDVSLWHPIKKVPYNPWGFSLSFSVEIMQYVDYLCLVGDPTDDIPGIHGIGPKRATDFLQKYGSIKAYLEDEDAIFTGMMDKDKVRKIYKRNRRLMDLKLFNRKYLKGAQITWIRGRKFPELNEAKFRAFCIKWNLKTMNTETFIKPFKELQNA